MKHLPRTFLSAALAVGTAASLVLSPLAAVIGSDLHIYDFTIHSGTVLSHGVYWGATANDKRTENYITYTPGADVKPIVTYGDKVTSTSTVSGAAKKLEAQGYRVVAGINGDYYYTSNGVPMGMVVTDGILRTGYNQTWAIGFLEDGTAIMGDPKLSVTMTYTHTVTEVVTPSAETGEGTEAGAPGNTGAADTAAETGEDTPPETITRKETVTYPIYTVNKARSTSGIFLYTNDFNTKGTTGNTEAGVDVVLVPADGDANTDLRIGQSLTMTVESVTEKTGATEVPAGKIVLSVNSKASAANIKALTDLTPGTTVTISVKAAGGWENAKYITSGYKKLIENGQVVSGLDTTGAPRTAIGMKDDGSLVFYTIDGRQSGYSVGASEALLAQRLQQLGCTTAICLDGGGSTTLTATLPSSTLSACINQPSGGSERAVSTQIFLVADNTPSGELDHYYISPVSTQLLAGAKVQLSGTAVDTNYIPMQDTTNPTWSTNFGTVNHNGFYTAPMESGTAAVTLSNGYQSGTAAVQVVANPDSLVARADGKVLTSLTTSAGRSYSLVMSAVYNHMTLLSQHQCFQFSVTGDIGTITPEGVFTAEKDGTGSIVITAGTAKLTIPVTVQSMPFTDVSLNAWYYDAVKYVYDNGLMSGTGNSLFSPAFTTTRNMIVQILYNKEGNPAVSYSGIFNDVPDGQWYTSAVEWAAGTKVVSGNGAGGFNPADNITREQLAVILYNYAAYAGYDTTTRGDTSTFTDAGKIHTWAADAMSWAVGTGVLKGSNNALNPLGTASRTEVAQVLMNFETIFSSNTSTDSAPDSKIVSTAE